MMDVITNVIEVLNCEIQKMFKRNDDNRDISYLTKRAQSLTKNWQQSMTLNNNNFEAEKKIMLDAEFAFDLFDNGNKIAYELKVSKNNISHELYKDIIKALIYNKIQSSPELCIKEFIFIMHPEAAQINCNWKRKIEDLMRANGIKLSLKKYRI